MTPSRLPQQLLFWVAVVVVFQITDTAAFSTHMPPPRQHALVLVPVVSSPMFQSHCYYHYGYGHGYPSQSALYSSTKEDKDKATASDDDHGDSDGDGKGKAAAALTDVDARVLQAMLQQDKLDANQEGNMRQLLERGIRAKEPTRKYSRNDDDDDAATGFQSSFFKTLDNTQLWKSLERSAQDLVESAKMFVTNRVERDTRLLGALGLFAFERAMQDVGRALPAAAKATKKTVLRLTNSSTNTASASRMTTSTTTTTTAADSTTSKKEIVDDMRLPMDEFKSVSNDIRDILKTGGAAGPASRRGLKTPAPAGRKNSKERFANALQRKQVTTLRQEKENPFAKSARVTSQFIDTAYELKRELQVEPNQPGYKTKMIRATAVDVTKRLKSGATQILAAAKREKSSAQLQGATEQGEELSLKSAAVQDQDNVMDATVAAFEAAAQPKVVETPIASKPETKKAAFFSTTVTADEVQLQGQLKAELSSLIRRLETCIDSPETTWLQPSLVENEIAKLSSESIEPIITAMVKAKQVLVQEKKLDSKSASTKRTRSLFDSLVVGKGLLDDVTDAAQLTGSQVVVDFLQRLFVYGDNYTPDRGLPLIARLGAVEQQVTAFDEGTTTTTAPQAVPPRVPQESSEAFDMRASGTKKQAVEEPVFVEPPAEGFESVVMEEEDTPVETYKAMVEEAIRNVIPEMVPPKPAANKGASNASYSYVDVVPETQYAKVYDYLVTTDLVGDNEVLSDDEASVYAEIVTDDYDESKAKAVSSAPADDEEREAEKPNALIQLTLRSFDVVFFLIEKAVTVRRCICLSVYSRAMYPTSHALFLLSCVCFMFIPRSLSLVCFRQEVPSHLVSPA
jgi:hypothetical protein